MKKRFLPSWSIINNMKRCLCRVWFFRVWLCLALITSFNAPGFDTDIKPLQTYPDDMLILKFTMGQSILLAQNLIAYPNQAENGAIAISLQEFLTAPPKNCRSKKSGHGKPSATNSINASKAKPAHSNHARIYRSSNRLMPCSLYPRPTSTAVWVYSVRLLSRAYHLLTNTLIVASSTMTCYIKTAPCFLKAIKIRVSPSCA